MLHLLSAFLLILSFQVFATTINDDLYRSIFRCDIDKVKFHLENGADPNASYNHKLNHELNIFFSANSANNVSPLVMAISFPCYKDKSSKIIKMLINHGANLNQRLSIQINNSLKDIPIPFLVFHTDTSYLFGIKNFLAMVEAGLDPHLRDYEGNNVLLHANYASANSGQILEILKLGVDYNDHNNAGYSMANLFPNTYFDNDGLKLLIDYLSGKELKYYTSDYRESFLTHPVVIQLYLLSSGYGNIGNYDFINFKQRLDIIFSKLIPMTKSAWNINIGKNEISPLTSILSFACPTTEYTKHLFFEFKPSSMSSDNSYSPIQNKKFVTLYKKIIQFLRENNVLDFDYIDGNGNSLQSYAIHLCPYELTKIIANKTKLPITKEQIKSSYDILKNLPRMHGKLIPFNNDHRNFKLLSQKNIDIDKLEIDNSNIRNQLLINEYQRPSIGWKNIEDLGFSLDSPIAFSAQIPYHFEQYTDIKKTKISITPGMSYKHHFSGRPIRILFGGTSTPTRKRGLSISEQTKNFDFRADKDIISYNIQGGFSHTGRINLKDGDFSGQFYFIIEETNTNKTVKKIFHYSRAIEFSKNSPMVISKPSNTHIISDLSYVFKKAHSALQCKFIVCNYLKYSYKNNNLIIEIDENKLKEQQPNLSKIWNYLNLSNNDKIEFLKHMYSDNDDSILPYALSLIPMNNDDAAIVLFDMILRREFQGQLLFEKLNLVNKLKNYDFKTNYGKSYSKTRLYLLTGKGKEEAFTSITENLQRKEEFLTLGDSLSFIPVYKKRIKHMLELMKVQK